MCTKIVYLLFRYIKIHVNFNNLSLITKLRKKQNPFKKKERTKAKNKLLT